MGEIKEVLINGKKVCVLVSDAHNQQFEKNNDYTFDKKKKFILKNVQAIKERSEQIRYSRLSPKKKKRFNNLKKRDARIKSLTYQSGNGRVQVIPALQAKKTTVGKVAIDAQCRSKLEERKLFFESREWVEARFRILIRDNRTCQCCGVNHKQAVMHVDHIKPISLYWNDRLKECNLQVLCAACNIGKSNKIIKDFRNI